MKLLLARSGPVVTALAVAVALAGCSSPASRPLPRVDPPSDADRTAAYELLVEQQTELLMSTHPGAVVPSVEVVRYVTPDEWAPAIAECMTAAGFEVRAHPDGGIGAELPPAGQEEAQAVANYTCMLQYPFDPIYTQPLNGEQQRYVYDYFVYELLPCLEGRGYPIDDPPTWQVFEETFTSSQWTPYSEVTPPNSEVEWDELIAACPPEPEHLFG